MTIEDLLLSAFGRGHLLLFPCFSFPSVVAAAEPAPAAVLVAAAAVPPAVLVAAAAPFPALFSVLLAFQVAAVALAASTFDKVVHLESLVAAPL